MARPWCPGPARREFAGHLRAGHRTVSADRPPERPGAGGADRRRRRQGLRLVAEEGLRGCHKPRRRGPGGDGVRGALILAVVVEAAFGGALVLAVFIGCRFRLPRDSGIKNAPRYLMPVPRTCSLFRRRGYYDRAKPS